MKPDMRTTVLTCGWWEEEWPPLFCACLVDPCLLEWMANAFTQIGSDGAAAIDEARKANR